MPTNKITLHTNTPEESFGNQPNQRQHRTDTYYSFSFCIFIITSVKIDEKIDSGLNSESFFSCRILSD